MSNDATKFPATRRIFRVVDVGSSYSLVELCRYYPRAALVVTELEALKVGESLDLPGRGVTPDGSPVRVTRERV